MSALNQDGNILSGLFDKGKDLKEDVKKKLKKLGLLGKDIKAIEELPEETQKEMMRLLGDFDPIKKSGKDVTKDEKEKNST